MKKSLLIFSFLVASFFAQAQNLQLSLSFDNNLTDLAKGRSVSAVNSPGYGTDALGMANSALLLTGTEYLRVDPNFITGTGSYSVSLWFQPSQLSGYNYILNSGGSNDNAGFLIATYNNSVLVTYRTSTATFNNTVGTIPFTLQTNSWYHVAGVYNAAEETLKAYINGSLVGSFTATAGTNGPGFDLLYIGVQGNSLQGFYHGKLDELYVYDKALTPNEIEVLSEALVTGVDAADQASAAPCLVSHQRASETFFIASGAQVLDLNGVKVPSLSMQQESASYKLNAGLYLLVDATKGCKTKLVVH